MISRTVSAIRHNLVAWLALFVAMGGTSLAASHYIINSTAQIRPSVLKRLHGARGTAGARGATGERGVTGAQGKEGLAGKGEKGEKGATGPEGLKGLKGERGEPGSPGGEKGEKGEKGEGEWKGAYSSGETYSKGQIVSEAGSTYISLQNANKGNTPKSSGAFWSLFSERGEKGATGERGATGEKGPGGGEAGPKAFAHISVSGVIASPPSSHGFEGAAVTQPKGKNKEGKIVTETGVYCISGLSLEPHSVIATLDSNESAETPVSITATLGIGNQSEVPCPAGTQITVEAFALGINSKKEEVFETVNQGFYLEVN